MQWTSSKVRFTPPPDASLLVNGQLIGELKNVGTFDPTVKNEVRANAAAPLGADGFAPASLLSVFAFPKTFLHNGAADSLDVVLANVPNIAVPAPGGATFQPTRLIARNWSSSWSPLMLRLHRFSESPEHRSKRNRQERKDRQGKQSLGMPSWTRVFLAFPRICS